MVVTFHSTDSALTELMPVLKGRGHPVLPVSNCWTCVEAADCVLQETPVVEKRTSRQPAFNSGSPEKPKKKCLCAL